MAAQLPALPRLARGLLREPADAEDLVHDSCVKALISAERAKFENDAGLGAWLKRIPVNTYRDQYRRSQRSPLPSNGYHATSDGSMNVYELVASTEQSAGTLYLPPAPTSTQARSPDPRWEKTGETIYRLSESIFASVNSSEIQL